MTEYDIFMHYYNDDIGKAVTNIAETEWYPCLTTIDEYDVKAKDPRNVYGDVVGQGNIAKYNAKYPTRTVNANDYVTLDYMKEFYNNKLVNDKESLEFIYISENTTSNIAENTEVYEKFVTNSMTIRNPKYDMIFIWDGLGVYENKYDKTDPKNQLYFDKMKRLRFRPWFLHSKYHSLKAAMIRASELIDLFGKDHIMVGKEVDLTQYIDIV
jgi:hypothetical protein